MKVDDAVALGMILTRKDIDILGIMTVSGNTNVENTTINTLKVLEAFDRKDIPVFKGAYSAIISEYLNFHECLFHSKGKQP